MRFAVAAQHAVLALALASCWLLVGGAGLAQPAREPPAAARAPAAASANVPLRVWVDATGETVDGPKLRESLSRELGREVVLAADAASADLRIRLSDETHAEVTYTTPSGEQLVRSVELPPDPERSVLVLSWLSLNLVRDEASEVLDELRARRKEEREAEARAALEATAALEAKAAADKAAADKAAVAAQPELLRDRRFDLALWTPISILPDSAKRELAFQVALGWGEAGAIRGVAASLGGLRLHQSLRGIAGGMAFVMVGGKARGILGSMGYAHLSGDLEGVQLAVGAAVHSGAKLHGAQLAVGGAIGGDVKGGQVGGGVTYARSLDGLSVAAGVTLLRQPSRALVVAGGANLFGDLDGVAVAGGANIGRDLRGAAIASVNVQRNVRGLQVGIVNVADQVDGAAIGIISVARNGRVQPVIWGSGDQSAHVAIKSIAGYVFTQFGTGVSLNADEVSFDCGIGAHWELDARFFLEPGVHYSSWVNTDSGSGPPDHQEVYYLVQAGLRLGEKLDLLAGVGLRHPVGDNDDAGVGPELRGGIAFF
ncbi:MAG TPA: hypothetical protein VIW29_15750 [Polyangiaceae bacterium]